MPALARGRSGALWKVNTRVTRDRPFEGSTPPRVTTPTSGGGASEANCACTKRTQRGGGGRRGASAAAASDCGGVPPAGGSEAARPANPTSHHVAAARELRDRVLERVNAGAWAPLTEPNYDVSRRIEGRESEQKRRLLAG